MNPNTTAEQHTQLVDAVRAQLQRHAAQSARTHLDDCNSVLRYSGTGGAWRPVGECNCGIPDQREREIVAYWALLSLWATGVNTIDCDRQCGHADVAITALGLLLGAWDPDCDFPAPAITNLDALTAEVRALARPPAQAPPQRQAPGPQ